MESSASDREGDCGTLGRPRDPERHRAVVNAVRELLTEIGYSSLSIDAIARRAGVSRQLVYRWWGTKSRVVAEAILDDPTTLPRPLTGDIATDIRELVQATVEQFMRSDVIAGLPGLQADIAADPVLCEEIQGRFTNAYLRGWKDLLDDAVSVGRLQWTYDAAYVAHSVIGMVSMLAQVTHSTPSSRASITDFVTAFVVGALHWTSPSC